MRDPGAPPRFVWVVVVRAAYKTWARVFALESSARSYLEAQKASVAWVPSERHRPERGSGEVEVWSPSATVSGDDSAKVEITLSKKPVE